MTDLQKLKYERKPLLVDAVQVTAENFEAVAKWCQGTITNPDNTEAEAYDPALGQHIRVRVHNPINARQSRAYVGDWLLYTERGYKIYRDKAFKNAFQPVETLVSAG